MMPQNALVGFITFAAMLVNPEMDHKGTVLKTWADYERIRAHKQ